MRVSRRALLLAASGACLALGLVYYRNRVADSYSARQLIALPAASFDESDVRDRDIAFYTQRLAEDSTSALDRSVLARLIFARARSTGSNRDLDRAEVLARESIAERTQRNYGAFELLASVLMTKHEFQAAKEVVMQLDSLNPGTPSHLALLGEIELELGEYESAAARFDAVNYDGRNFTTAARLARWHELTGQAGRARAILVRSIEGVKLRDDLPREQVAWFHYRLGDLELRVGNIAAAESAFVRGLALNQGDVRVLGGLARAALARGEWVEAIDFGEQATADQLDPSILTTLSIAYTQLGDTARASGYARAMSVSERDQPGIIHREWGLYLLDHGTAYDRAEILRHARRELSDRKDVYGHDMMAWASYRNGNLDDARKYISLALAQGTEDVLLAKHARAISSAR